MVANYLAGARADLARSALWLAVDGDADGGEPAARTEPTARCPSRACPDGCGCRVADDSGRPMAVPWQQCPGGATGRRGPLKTGCPHGHVGSSPHPGHHEIQLENHVRADIQLQLVRGCPRICPHTQSPVRLPACGAGGAPEPNMHGDRQTIMGAVGVGLGVLSAVVASVWRDAVRICRLIWPNAAVGYGCPTRR